MYLRGGPSLLDRITLEVLAFDHSEDINLDASTIISASTIYTSVNCSSFIIVRSLFNKIFLA